MLKILVTGGAGFIGSNYILRSLRERPGLRIVCLDKLTYAGSLSTLRPALGDPRLKFVKGDICDRAAASALIESERPGAVVNFAAETHVDRSIRDPGGFLEANIAGVASLMDACLKHGVGRFHQVSTDEVYGDLPLDRPDLQFTEETPLKGSSPYSASKAAADLLVLAYCRTYGLKATITRCSNNYGPRQFPEKLFPLMITRALEGKPLPVYGSGLNVRDWLHVEDHCRAVELVLHGGRPGEVYNVGAGNEMRNIDVVRAICGILGKPESLIEFVDDRRGHDLRYAVDSTKLREELGWRPETKFESGLRETVQWYLDNREWWQPLLARNLQGN
jgi:dTDP-glucose 4,6-dehydratase